MFRPVRTLFLVLIAFVAGVFYERGLQRDACAAQGGSYDRGMCRMGVQ